MAQQNLKEKSSVKDVKQKILLVDVDSTIPNLALMKLSTFYKQKGKVVELLRLRYDGKPGKRSRTLIRNKGYEQVYISIVFTPNKNVIKIEDETLKNYQFGGTGYDLTTKLPQEIDDIEEDYSIYPDAEFYVNFLTRGCIRACPWCVVSRKEGMICSYRTVDYVVAQMKKWSFKKAKFLDNNILSHPKCEEILQKIIDNKIICQFNQGMDMRLMTEKKAILISKIRYIGEHFFAFDHISVKEGLEKNFPIYQKHNPAKWRSRLYIYVDANLPIKDVVYRIEWCRKHHALCYMMRDKNCFDSPNKKLYNLLTGYCQGVPVYKKYTFEEHIMKNKIKDVNEKMKVIKVYRDCLKQIKDEEKIK